MKEGSSERGSKQAWLDVAYKVLIESGIDAVRILPLSKRLNLSRTSFYWYFEDREDLLEALVEMWRGKNTGNLVGRANAYAETIAEAVLNVFDCWFDSELFNSRLEFAIRSWARSSVTVAAEVSAADIIRIQAFKEMLTRFDIPELMTDARARTIYLTQIGYISLQTSEDIETRLLRIPEYIEIFTGTRAQQREIDRFIARHRQDVS